MSNSRTRVMLVTPPYHSGVVEAAGVWLPLGLVYLAGEARKAGAEVRVYDAMSLQHSHEDIAREIEDFAPDILGVGAYTALEPDAREVCQSAKLLNPEVTTVLGGVHPTFMWQDVLDSEPAVDVVVRGEGEGPLSDLVRVITEGGDLAKVKGLALRRDGAAFATPAREMAKDLDVFSPAWDLVDWPTCFHAEQSWTDTRTSSSSRSLLNRP